MQVQVQGQALGQVQGRHQVEMGQVQLWQVQRMRLMVAS